ncbi:hypothetical protein SAMD00019534_094820 [Acytostelium subglobosum LB1]|uniref:hypothetical protein n=1 Tax=Acytostelium subglobosum LB1 TaxID=1410327 RepID=UPI0006447BFB|nr:hypothetical protein SAMD00019534_094820 [Acytostelium subglobosum LB1]GAM26307.1 hypothetical protein SAMD00019534_094820 [Acytostelium subglobosum LB1]|eukprot:XP_012750861.1 hypothetical protein SAMD00019534_094820 [Acytostelium subglobosum LB1]
MFNNNNNNIQHLTIDHTNVSPMELVPGMIPPSVHTLSLRGSIHVYAGSIPSSVTKLYLQGILSAMMVGTPIFSAHLQHLTIQSDRLDFAQVPDSVTYINADIDDEAVIGHLPPTLKHLEICSWDVSFELAALPQSITFLEINNGSRQWKESHIESLAVPSHLWPARFDSFRELLPYGQLHNMHSLDGTITTLDITLDREIPIEHLPPSITKLTLRLNEEHPRLNFPLPNLRTLILVCEIGRGGRPMPNLEDVALENLWKLDTQCYVFDNRIIPRLNSTCELHLTNLHGIDGGDSPALLQFGNIHMKQWTEYTLENPELYLVRRFDQDRLLLCINDLNGATILPYQCPKCSQHVEVSCISEWRYHDESCPSPWIRSLQLVGVYQLLPSPSPGMYHCGSQPNLSILLVDKAKPMNRHYDGVLCDAPIINGQVLQGVFFSIFQLQFVLCQINLSKQHQSG